MAATKLAVWRVCTLFSMHDGKIVETAHCAEAAWLAGKMGLAKEDRIPPEHNPSYVN